MTRAWVLVVALLAGCPHHTDNKPPKREDARPADDAPGAAALPPPPMVPGPPRGLPEDPINPLLGPALALGEALFSEPHLSTTGTISCSTCHDPARDYSGLGRQPTAAGSTNLRHAPSLSNIKWRTELGWDGRYPTLDDQLPPHIRGQLGDELASAVARIADLPVYRAHFARIAQTDTRSQPEIALFALEIFVRTRFQGDSPWDRAEHAADPPAELKAGYTLFMSKAQCAVCHPPPLYTDVGYHRLGLIATKDEGRGRVSTDQAGAFATPSVRGAALRTSFFHDGSATTLDAAIDWHLAGGTGQGADSSIIDPALKPVKLTATERAQLGAFVRALTRAGPQQAKPAP